MNRNAHIVIDFNHQTGLGHLMRGIAIWQMINLHIETTLYVEKKSRKTASHFFPEGINIRSFEQKSLINNLAKFEKKDIFFFDGYQFDEKFRKKINETRIKKVFIDDFGKGSFDCDVVINHADLDKNNLKLYKHTKLFFGFDYLMLRESFFKKSNYVEKQKSVLITFGGTPNPIVTKIMLIILKFNFIDNISIIGQHIPTTYSKSKISFFNDLDEKKMAEKFHENEIIICQSSTTALECFVMDKKMIIVKTEENQNLIYDTLKQKKNVIGYSHPKKLNNQNLSRDLIFLKNSKFYNRNIPYPKENFIGLIKDL